MRCTSKSTGFVGIKKVINSKRTLKKKSLSKTKNVIHKEEYKEKQ